MVFDGNEWIRQGGYAYIEKTGVDIVWDGNPEGRDYADIPDGPTIYKVSDAILTVDDVVGKTMTVEEDGNQETFEIEREMCVEMDGYFVVAQLLLSFSKTTISEDGFTLTVPSTGTYAIWPVTLSCESTVVHPFDSRFVGGSGGDSGGIRVFKDGEFQFTSSGTIAVNDSGIIKLEYQGSEDMTDVYPLYAIVLSYGRVHYHYMNARCIDRSENSRFFSFNLINAGENDYEYSSDDLPYAVVCLVGNGELDWRSRDAQ